MNQSIRTKYPVMARKISKSERTAEVIVETRVTWVVLAVRLSCWLKSKWLLNPLNGAILGRVYVNGKLSKEIRLDIKKNSDCKRYLFNGIVIEVDRRNN